MTCWYGTSSKEASEDMTASRRHARMQYAQARLSAATAAVESRHQCPTDVSRQRAAVKSTLNQTASLTELVTSRECQRIRDRKNQRNDYIELASSSTTLNTNLYSTHQQASTK